MKKYYILWHYNKIPFVYSIMNSEDENIIILNINNCYEAKDKIKKLEKLDKIAKIIFVKNDVLEILKEIFYRVLIFPLKNLFDKKNVEIYLDGFNGVLPLVIANIIGKKKYFFYEEGQGIYLNQGKSSLFQPARPSNLATIINKYIKRMLGCPVINLDIIEKIYVRDKKKLYEVFEYYNYNHEFRIVEINEKLEISKMKKSDKDRIEEIFFKGFFIEKEKRKVIILTQPLHHFYNLTEIENAELFNKQIKKYLLLDYKIYLKMHPIEKKDIYLKDEKIIRINSDIPFEFLSIKDIEFEYGVTYDSTAIRLSIIKNKVILSENIQFSLK